jgi:thiamine transporter
MPAKGEYSMDIFNRMPALRVRLILFEELFVMQKKNIIALVEAGVMVGLSYVLNLIVLFQMPQGGSVTLGSMVPIILISVRRGPYWGILTGVLAGLMQFILGRQYSLHPLSIILDYLLAYGIIGIVAYFGKKRVNIASGTLLAVFLRFVSHVVSGAIIFYEYAGDQNPWIYSIIYNGSFLVPELAVTLILSLLILSSSHVLNPGE